MMRFVDVFVKEWQMKPSMNPIYAIVGKEEESEARTLSRLRKNKGINRDLQKRR
jgi:hypothetical protein